MSAIFKREFHAYFSSPIGYVFIAMFYCLSGFFFFLDNLAVGFRRTAVCLLYAVHLFSAVNADFDNAHAQ